MRVSTFVDTPGVAGLSPALQDEGGLERPAARLMRCIPQEEAENAASEDDVDVRRAQRGEPDDGV